MIQKPSYLLEYRPSYRNSPIKKSFGSVAYDVYRELSYIRDATHLGVQSIVPGSLMKPFDEHIERLVSLQKQGGQSYDNLKNACAELVHDQLPWIYTGHKFLGTCKLFFYSEAGIANNADKSLWTAYCHAFLEAINDSVGINELNKSLIQSPIEINSENENTIGLSTVLCLLNENEPEKTSFFNEINKSRKNAKYSYICNNINTDVLFLSRMDVLFLSRILPKNASYLYLSDFKNQNEDLYELTRHDILIEDSPEGVDPYFEEQLSSNIESYLHELKTSISSIIDGYDRFRRDSGLSAIPSMYIKERIEEIVWLLKESNGINTARDEVGERIREMRRIDSQIRQIGSSVDWSAKIEDVKSHQASRKRHSRM